MATVTLIDPEYDSWTSSTRGPCNCWHGAGCEARASYLAPDGITYKLIYQRDYPVGTVYVVAPASNTDELQSFTSLKAAAKSPHLPAFRALLAFAKTKGE